MNADSAYGGAMDNNPFGELLSENELKDVLDLETPQAALTMAPEDDSHESSLTANVPMPAGPFSHDVAFGDFSLDTDPVTMQGGQQILSEDLTPSPWANVGASLLPTHGVAPSMNHAAPPGAPQAAAGSVRANASLLSPPSKHAAGVKRKSAYPASPPSKQSGHPKGVNQPLKTANTVDLDIDADLNPEEKKAIRMKRNREAAHQSRVRHKEYVEGLEKTVEQLRAETSNLRQANQALLQEVQRLGGNASLFAAPTLPAALSSGPSSASTGLMPTVGEIQPKPSPGESFASQPQLIQQQQPLQLHQQQQQQQLRRHQQQLQQQGEALSSGSGAGLFDTGVIIGSGSGGSFSSPLHSTGSGDGSGFGAGTAVAVNSLLGAGGHHSPSLSPLAAGDVAVISSGSSSLLPSSFSLAFCADESPTGEAAGKGSSGRGMGFTILLATIAMLLVMVASSCGVVLLLRTSPAAAAYAGLVADRQDVIFNQDFAAASVPAASGASSSPMASSPSVIQALPPSKLALPQPPNAPSAVSHDLSIIKVAEDNNVEASGSSSRKHYEARMRMRQQMEMQADATAMLELDHGYVGGSAAGKAKGSHNSATEAAAGSIPNTSASSFPLVPSGSVAAGFADHHHHEVESKPQHLFGSTGSSFSSSSTSEAGSGRGGGSPGLSDKALGFITESYQRQNEWAEQRNASSSSVYCTQAFQVMQQPSGSAESSAKGNMQAGPVTSFSPYMSLVMPANSVHGLGPNQHWRHVQHQAHGGGAFSHGSVPLPQYTGLVEVQCKVLNITAMPPSPAAVAAV